MFITVWLFISPFIFKLSFRCIQTVYIAYQHYNCLESHGNMTYGTWLPGYSTFHQIYIRYILHIDGNSDILLSCGWYSEVSSSHCILLLYDCTLMSTHFHCIYFLYNVYTLCWHSHMGFTYTKRIHLVYLWYTSLHKKVHSVYNMYTSYFIFLGCIYDHRTFMLFQT